MRHSSALWICWLLFALGAAAEILADPITYQTVKSGRGDTVTFRNSASVPVTIKLQLTLKNVAVSGPSDLLVVPSHGSLVGPSFRVADAKKAWKFHWTYRYNFGSSTVREPSAPFFLPWARGASFKIGQAFEGKLSHFGDERYSVDIPMPEGTPIYAARDGLVVYVRESFSEGGWRPELRDKDNHVLIAHSDGTLSRYLHLRHDGAIVELGQWVKAGDPIGYSGNVGYSSGPHLHFDVSRPGRDLVTQTIPFVFNVKGRRFVPVDGAVLER